MGKSRIDAFSDGVIAIIVAIMVLDLKMPHGASFNDLIALAPIFLGYVLSFIYVGICWNKLQYANYPSGCGWCSRGADEIQYARKRLWQS